jgi:hypothetical protein
MSAVLAACGGGSSASSGTSSEPAMAAATAMTGTRYDKLSERFSSFVALSAAFIWTC